MKTHLILTGGVFLGLVSGLRADYERPGPGPNLDALSGWEDGRAWDLWIRAYAGYDDNVQFISDSNTFFAGDRESGYLGFTMEGVYRFLQRSTTEAGVALRLDRTFHMEGLDSGVGPGWTDEANNFDLTVVEPALYLSFRNDDGGIYGRAAYSFRDEDSEGTGIGGESHNVGLMLGTEVSSCLHLELDYEHGWDDFDVVFANPASDRDGERDRLSLSLIQPGGASAPRIILRYSYLNNDADGSNFEYDGHELLLRVESQLAERVSGALQVSYADLDYNTWTPGAVRSEHEVVKAGVQLVYAIDENWSADFYYNYLEVEADTAIFEGERNDVGLGLRYDF